jgi:hypothetical protein
MRIAYTILLLVSASLSFVACREDELIGTPPFEHYKYTQLDAEAGQWVPILIDSTQAQAFISPAPDEANSPTAIIEREAIKSLQNNKTATQQRAIDYWGTSSVARWNEIARDLAAKYNRLPSPDDNGVYPAPSGANPGNYPNFPVASPPYSARAFAYLGTATFDAMIVCWKSKYTYNRAAPSTMDNQIQNLLPLSDLPSYPSEDAVAGAVAFTILSRMFPLEEAYLKSKFEEL